MIIEEVVEEKNQELLEDKLERSLSLHAKEKIGTEGSIEKLKFIAKKNKEIMGAISAKTFFNGLHITYLYIESSYRHLGVATALLEKVIAIGKKKGCTFAYLETMSFQAVDFYKNLGFKEEFVRHGYAKGASFHYMKKEI